MTETAAPAPDFTLTAPAVTDYTNGSREIRFVAMQHIATKAFYDAAIAIVREAQEAGAIHFYEFIDLYRLSDTDQRKVRKVMQFLPMPDVYASLATAIGAQLDLPLVAQSFTDLVGLVNETDVNADIEPQEFLRRLEAAVGPIELRQEDLDTPIGEAVSEGVPQERWMAAALDSRNVDLAASIRAAPHERIVITYGAAHEPGWLAEMRKLDPTWGPTPG
jgi:hypothetical protein